MYSCPECNKRMEWNGNTDDGERAYFQYSCEPCGIELIKYINELEISEDDIALIVEIGRLYKHYNPDWIYGSLETYVKSVFSEVKAFWNNGDHTLQCDEAVEVWFDDNYKQGAN